MPPITILWAIVVIGSVLLLGLFGGCAYAAYRTVTAPSPLESASEYDKAD